MTETPASSRFEFNISTLTCSESFNSPCWVRSPNTAGAEEAPTGSSHDILPRGVEEEDEEQEKREEGGGVVFVTQHEWVCATM